MYFVYIVVFVRVLKPPGGEDSDIFGVRSPSTPITASPRRVIKGQTSNIFGYADETDRASGISSGASTPRRKMSTSSQERLFGIYRVVYATNYSTYLR
ncbi:hypothetical protein BIW11_10618 [Tropilaelaps mercedesae]|uniref:Uncharacterized protein n=1 Tax=Tropilaelaps mercedesae TaxID=418985 RepID=A0A1V9XF65_9ACAR|nr:hypothetical protein BIW11_10618 [Tropilaelaps mercedesae]